MTRSSELSAVAATLVAGGKGILAADESIGTMNRRLENAGVAPTVEHRRTYRELLATTPGLADGVSGIILCDETFRQSTSDGETFPRSLSVRRILTGVKVDTGAKPLAGAPGETVTEGLDGLRERLAEYRELGAAFAKWRAVLVIGDGKPGFRARQANAHAMARYAALCQEAGIVPIVEPEVLMAGDHSAAACAAATAVTLRDFFAELEDAGVALDGIVLKPNMVVPGEDSGEVATPDQVASATVGTLRTVVPAKVAGVAFLSGGQPAAAASANLAAMQQLATPWPLTFSFGRALVDPALAAWRGDPEQVAAGQRALAHRVRCNSAALQGVYDEAVEDGRVPA
ncbi:class I fructose-bisphosphate aldolase [Amycolatopsis sp. SID8362]|uniref:class I fructose-bisphosphate aldolase n=1 Tax=Amycolatopsis sp. SID8362 TaxID=2690346 RepID=UPI00136C7BAA|nr:class I fructose-bisphosphate aldolase [Amycolatopsis sp. SID8362]NBH06672.1 fructose-bisphosphate aldolase class I [Amycolatopsis sp. SID8362]NED43369.1 fructose-bisphosphate aldolase class I [Amycolatopsis sp. SID8362]